MFISHQWTMFLRPILKILLVFLIVPILCSAQLPDWNVRSLSTSRARLTMFKTRNMFQCERLCLRYKPCVAVSYSTKSRECSMYSEELTEDDVTPNRDGIVSTGISGLPDFCSTADCRADSVCVTTGNQSVCLPTARDCQEILETDSTAPDGVYTIRTGSQLIEAYCDMTDDGGGWTLLQRRTDGSENFYRNWHDYRKGFGNPGNEFWLGNENIFHLTKQNNHLKVVMEKFDNDRAFASYSEFRIEDEEAMYRLTVGGYTGTAGNALAFHNNMAFTTYDVDNDKYVGNCANLYFGGWWYKWCHQTNLNGQYNNTIYGKGLSWLPFVSPLISLKFVEMKIRH